MHTTEQLNIALAGRYAIEGLLGEGGMATVYLAPDIKHQRNVALKVLKPDLGAVVGVERFLGEIQVTPISSTRPSSHSSPPEARAIIPSTARDPQHVIPSGARG